MKTQRIVLESLIVPALLAGALVLFWRQLAWILAWIVLVPVFILLLVVSASCGGLSESQWRRQLEPLLPEGVTIVDSRTGDCMFDRNCNITFLLDHDGLLYAENVAAFEAAMVARGWTKVGGVSRDSSASASFTKDGIKVWFRLLSLASSQRCLAASQGKNASCESALSIWRDQS